MIAKEMKELPKGTYSNSDLNKMFPGHCKPKGTRPETHVYYRKPTSKLGGMYVHGLKNRRQRRQGFTA